MRRKRKLDRSEIFKALRENKSTLKKFKVKRIGLFGSYAEGTQTAKSDIDFVVEFKEPTFDNFMDLVYWLEKVFKRKVEVLTPAGVKSIRVKEVKEEIKRSIVYG